MRAAERAVIGDRAWNGIFRRIKVVILDVEGRVFWFMRLLKEVEYGLL